MPSMPRPTEPHYADSTITLYHQPTDGFSVLASLPGASVDAVVCDPPYGLEFMGKTWDGADGFRRTLNPNDVGRDNAFGRTSRTSPEYRAGTLFQQWCELWTAECLRVLKPGGHMLAFGGTRTWHRLACAVEDAGFEVRDSIAWMYGSGFPKSLDVSKAIDKRCDWSLVGKLADAIRAARVKSGLSLREVGEAVKMASGGTHGEWYHRGGHMFFETGISLPGRGEWQHLRSVLPIPTEFDAMYEEAERQIVRERTMTQGGGTSLQLRMGEAREVRADITAPTTPDAQRWAGWGTALKPAFEPIVVGRKPLVGTVAANVLAHGTGAINIDGCRIEGATYDRVTPPPSRASTDDWRMKPGTGVPNGAGRWPANVILDESQAAELDAQSGTLTSGKMQPTHTTAAREVFGQNADGGYTTMETYGDTGGASRFFYVAKADQSERVRVDGIAHPTVKPLDIMRWLVRLVTPPGGTVLEPFAGSGTTVEACILEGFKCIAIEREADYLPLIVQRINRRRDPVAAVKATGDDAGLFDLLGEATA